LLLDQEDIEHAAQGFGGIGVLIKRLLVELLRLGKLLCTIWRLPNWM